MTLPEIHSWRDPLFRRASLQMALDEALFHWSVASGRAALRFYHWDRPALTTGYFHPTKEGETITPPGAVRRFTGGGLVEHGEDLTFVLTLPAATVAARASGTVRYRWIHETLAAALATAGFPCRLETAPGPTGPCFTHPVPWDLKDPLSGRKIGGGAQRRSRGAVIHQGSVRLPPELRDPEAVWLADFIDRLALKADPLTSAVKEEIARSAGILERERYRSEDWNTAR